MHGAQDGQKFMSIFVLAITLAMGTGQADQMTLPIWLMFFCALNMGIGTASWRMSASSKASAWTW